MQVYISHAFQDQDLARDLAQALSAQGIVVANPDAVLPGANWAAERGRALEQSDTMVVLLSRNNRESSSIKQDVQFALTEGNYGGHVIPVLVNMPTFVAGSDVPWVLIRFDAISVSGSPPDFAPVVKRLVELARVGSNASA